jgi:hypothetical protein
MNSHGFDCGSHLFCIFRALGDFFFLLVYFCWSALIACSWCKKNGHGHQDFLFGGTTFGNLLLYVSGSTVVGLQRSGLSDGNVSRSKTLTYFVESRQEKKIKNANKVHLLFYVYGR